MSTTAFPDLVPDEEAGGAFVPGRQEADLPRLHEQGSSGDRPTGRLTTVWRGRPQDPRWARPALLALLAGTALLYLWGLGASGEANSFYAAAVQAGTKSWKALFFGSLDSSNFITVDKPPAALWVMGLSGRIFGFNSWSMLVPQALEGVAAVGLLHAAVRRWAGPVAGLLAAAAFALTPVAVLMFRFNNPDALLTLLLVAGGYCVVRALDHASNKSALRWIMLAGTCLGFAFLTKMLQAFLVLPAFGLAYLIAAPTSLGRRIVHLLAGLGALLVSAGWWVAAVELWPASSRPYIGGSTNNSVLDLVFGYNGLSRLTGGSSGSPGGGADGGTGFGGATGLTRMFGTSFGTQVSWLLPAALIALVAGIALRGRAPRTDRTRAALILWGGWLLGTGVVLSYMQGITHPYYSVALAPGITATLAVGAREAWLQREHWYARAALAAMVVATGAWSWELLGRVSWHPELRVVVITAAVLGAVALLAPPRRVGRAVVASAMSLALVAGLGGSAAYAVSTASTPHTGSTPVAGPAGTSQGAGGSAPGGAGTGGTGGFSGTASGTRPTGTPPAGMTPPSGSTGTGGTSTGTTGGGTSGTSSGSTSRSAVGGGSTTTSSALTALLKATTTRWAAATIGSQNAASIELASGTAVMAIGGWSGSDNAPTLAQFEAWVAQGKVRYFIAGGGMGGQNGSASASQITAWVEAHFSHTTVGGSTVYDLSKQTG